MGAYRTTFETPLGTSPYKLVYGKTCHPSIELQHKAFGAIKELDFNLQVVGQVRILQLNELEEHRLFSYENIEIYKKKGQNLSYVKKC